METYAINHWQLLFETLFLVSSNSLELDSEEEFFMSKKKKVFLPIITKHKNLNSPLLAIIVVVIVLLITLNLFLSQGGNGKLCWGRVKGGAIPGCHPPPSPPFLYASMVVLQGL